MQEANIIQQLQKANEQFVQVFSTFNRKQINLVPYKDSWTPAQVAQHVLKSEGAILLALKVPGKKADRNTYARVSELKNIFLDFSSKMQSPDFILPEQKEYDKEELLTQWDEISSQLLMVAEYDNKEEMINGLPLGDITKGEAIHFLLYHCQRHTHQLQRISEAINNKTKAVETTQEVIVRRTKDAYRDSDTPQFFLIVPMLLCGK